MTLLFSQTKSFKITQSIINQFANLIGDHNPIHIDPHYAAKTRFQKTLLHGVYGLGYLTHMIPPKYQINSFQILFKKPIFANDNIQAILSIYNNKQTYELEYTIIGQDKKVRSIVKGLLNIRNQQAQRIG